MSSKVTWQFSAIDQANERKCKTWILLLKCLLALNRIQHPIQSHFMQETSRNSLVTESQNRKCWKRPLGSSSPTTVLTTRTCPQVLHAPVFWTFPGTMTAPFPGQPFPMLYHPFREIISMMYDLNLPWRNLRPFARVPSLLRAPFRRL